MQEKSELRNPGPGSYQLIQVKHLQAVNNLLKSTFPFQKLMGRQLGNERLRLRRSKFQESLWNRSICDVSMLSRTALMNEIQ